MSSNSLHRSEILKSQEAIRRLFADGSKLHEFPVMLIWRWVEPRDTSIKMAFSVSKRSFKRAVDRNRIKRLLREAYRTQNEGLKLIAQEKEQTLEGMLVYTGKKMPEWKALQGKIITLLSRLQHEE